MAKIFISYGREDRQEAVRIYESLKGAGYEPWLDIKDLVGGEDWKRAIRLAMSEASVMIAVLSPSSGSRRGYVHAEVREGLELRKQFPEDQIFLIPVRLEDFRPKQLDLGDLQWVDLFLEDGPARLMRAVDSAVGAQQDTQKSSGSLRPTQDVETKSDASDLICEICKEKIKYGARVCPHCNSRIEYVSNRSRFLKLLALFGVPIFLIVAGVFVLAMSIDFHYAILTSLVAVAILASAVYFSLDGTLFVKFRE